MRDNFSKRLKELRLENHFTQREIAAKLGVAQVFYLHWEQGKTEPSIDNIFKLCEIFGVTSDYLLGIGKNKRTTAGRSFYFFRRLAFPAGGYK